MLPPTKEPIYVVFQVNGELAFSEDLPKKKISGTVVLVRDKDEQVDSTEEDGDEGKPRLRRFKFANIVIPWTKAWNFFHRQQGQAITVRHFHRRLNLFSTDGPIGHSTRNVCEKISNAEFYVSHFRCLEKFSF